MRVILAEELLEVYKCDLLTLGEAGRRRQTLSASWIAWLKFFMSICSSARCARKLAIEDAMGEKRRENEWMNKSVAQIQLFRDMTDIYTSTSARLWLSF